MIEILGFDWDEANLRKLAKHRVTQEEAEEIFYLRPLIDEGAYEKAGEKRYRCLGKTMEGRFLAAFFTIRDGLIRNISVRTMRKKEREAYEESEKGS